MSFKIYDNKINLSNQLEKDVIKTELERHLGCMHHVLKKLILVGLSYDIDWDWRFITPTFIMLKQITQSQLWLIRKPCCDIFCKYGKSQFLENEKKGVP